MTKKSLSENVASNKTNVKLKFYGISSPSMERPRRGISSDCLFQSMWTVVSSSRRQTKKTTENTHFKRQIKRVISVVRIRLVMIRQICRRRTHKRRILAAAYIPSATVLLARADHQTKRSVTVCKEEGTDSTYPPVPFFLWGPRKHD